MVIILTNSWAHVYKFENGSWQDKRKSLHSCSTIVICIATLACFFLQSNRNLITTRFWFGHLCIVKLFKAVSYAHACLAIIYRFHGFIAHKQSYSAKSKSSEYFNVFSYIIASLVVTLYNSNSGIWPASIWLNIQLSQQLAKFEKSFNGILHIKHAHINCCLYPKVF